MKSVMQLNKESKSIFYVIDDFYENPDEVRQLALKTQKNADIRYWKGKRSYPLPKDQISHIKVV